MYIFQKNFNTITIPEIKSPWLRENISLPAVNEINPNSQENSINSEDSHRPDSVNSSVNPELQNPLFRNPVQRAIANTRASETEEILSNDARAQNKSLLNKLVREHDSKEKAKELAGKAKDAVVEGYNKLAENYGEGLTGSLGTDAALAAGGLALAGGAYHLLKKRRAKKKAEKEALENRIKK